MFIREYNGSESLPNHVSLLCTMRASCVGFQVRLDVGSKYTMHACHKSMAGIPDENRPPVHRFCRLERTVEISSENGSSPVKLVVFGRDSRGLQRVTSVFVRHSPR